MYLLKLSLRPWKSAFMYQISGVFTIAFLLFVVVTFQWMSRALSPVIARMKHEQVVTVYLAADTAAQEKEIIDAVTASLGAKNLRSDQVKLVREEEFLEQMKEQAPELVSDLKSMGEDLKYLVPRFLSITGEFEGLSLQKISQIAGVESVETSKDKSKPTVSAFITVQWLMRGLLLGSVLVLLSSFIHLIKTNQIMFRETLMHLRLMGASNVLSKLPAVLSSLSVGILGGALAALSWVVLGPKMIHQMGVVSPLLKGWVGPNIHEAIFILMAGCALGLVVGFFQKFDSQVKA